MERQTAQAELFIDGEMVGTVDVQGADRSWSFGLFSPNDTFSKFAPIFGQWSLLMNEDTDRTLHEATSDELQRAEIAIDQLSAKLYYPKTDKWEKAAQVNIDGSSIEWKHY